MLRLAYAGAPTFLLLLILANGGARSAGTSKERAAAEAARFVSQTFSLAGVVLVLILPLWICPTIVRERKSGGFDLIRTTQLSIREVLLGLAGASAVVSTAVIASLAPVLSMIMLLGGVDFYSVLANSFRLALEVVCLTGACLYTAAVHESPVRATILGAFWGLVAFAGFGIVSLPALNTVMTVQSSNQFRMVGFLGCAAFFGFFAGALFLGWLHGAASAMTRGGDVVFSPRPRFATKSKSDSPDVKRSAMWGPLKIRLDDSEPTRFQIRAVWFLYLAVGMPFCWLIRTDQGATISPLLFLLWVAIQPFLIVVAATNPLLGRRPGFFDDLLTTNLPEKEIVAGVLWIVQPALLRLLAAPLGLAVLWFALHPVGNAAGSLIGLAWTAELVLVGAIVSLADNRLSMRLLGILVFWIAAVAAPVFARSLPSPEIATLPFVAAGSAVAAWVVQRRITWLRTILFCLFLHSALACLGGWVGSFFLTQIPPDTLDLVNPFSWMVTAFWSPQSNDFRVVARAHVPVGAFPFAVASVAAALLFWWWIEKKFNQLVGRTDLKSTRPKRRDPA